MRRFTLSAFVGLAVLGLALASPMRASADTSPMPIFMPSPESYAPVPQTTFYPQLPVVFYGITARPPCAPSCDPSCPSDATCSPDQTCAPTCAPAPTCHVPHHEHRDCR
jgi:hypothetical protein